MDNPIDWNGVIFGMGVLTLGTIILIVVLIVAERFYRARLQSRDRDRLVAMVEQYEKTSEATTRHQEVTTGELTSMRARLDAIERMLREVD